MGKSYVVVTSELQKAAKELKEYSETYTNIYKELFEKAGTMGEAWKGDDNLRFVEQINGFCKEMQDMVKKLVVASETLDQIAKNYLDQEERNIQAVQKLTN